MESFCEHWIFHGDETPWKSWSFTSGPVASDPESHTYLMFDAVGPECSFWPGQPCYFNSCAKNYCFVLFLKTLSSLVASIQHSLCISIHNRISQKETVQCQIPRIEIHSIQLTVWGLWVFANIHTHTKKSLMPESRGCSLPCWCTFFFY